MSTDLREELDALARTQAFTPDPAAWDRGRRARRRGRVAAVAAVLVLVASVGGLAATWSSDREARTATAEVPQGAIPSRIDDPGTLPLEQDLAVGRASVAFLSAEGQAVVVDATDGSYHALDLPDGPEDGGLVALSPDGRYLAWSNQGRIHDVDLEDGLAGYFGSEAEHTVVTGLRWPPRSDQLLWSGTDESGAVTGGVLPAGAASGLPLPTAALRGIPSPDDDLVAVASEGPVDAAPFLRPRGKQGARPLPSDLYPDGATVRPLGWSQDHLAVAELDAPPGSYVEGRHVVLMTSPDEPESRWTFRVLLRDVPPGPSGLSLAVDLLPDLDGTSSQVLTHDFSTAPPSADRDRWDPPYALAGLLALLSGFVLVGLSLRRP